jgi:thioesterase domain-containing protein
VFGGSACALGILAAWSLIHVNLLKEPDIKPRIVIQRNTMEYKKPILSTFAAHCALENEEAWEKFLNSIRKKGVGRMQLTSHLLCRDEDVGEFKGTFVTFHMNQ